MPQIKRLPRKMISVRVRPETARRLVTLSLARGLSQNEYIDRLVDEAWRRDAVERADAELAGRS